MIDLKQQIPCLCSMNNTLSSQSKLKVPLNGSKISLSSLLNFIKKYNYLWLDELFSKYM